MIMETGEGKTIMEIGEGEGNMVQGTEVWNEDGHFSPNQIQQHFRIHSPPSEPSKRENDGFPSPSVPHKRIKFLPEWNQKEVEVDSSKESSTLGLTLKKTPSFLHLIETKLSQVKKNGIGHLMDDSGKARMEDFISQPMSERLKASNFPASYLRIGDWERMSRYEGDLIAKCYYAKRKLVWEVLEGALKSKIEIQWTDILAMRASINDNEAGILEIELNQPPLFFREINPQPRKHTLWRQAHDFTGGQAPICRRHYVKFLPGILDRHYEKLLQCDSRLLLLSQQPFPSLDNPYFYENIYNFGDFNRCRPEFLSAWQHPLQNFSRPLIPSHYVHNFKPRIGLPCATGASNSPMSGVMQFSHMDRRPHHYAALENQSALSLEGLNRMAVEGSNYIAALENQSASLVEGSNQVFDISIKGDQPTLVNPVISYKNGQLLSDIEGNTQGSVISYQDGQLLSNIEGNIQGGGVKFRDQNSVILNDIEEHLLGDTQDHLEYEEGVMNDQMMFGAIEDSPINDALLCSKHVGLSSRQDFN